LKDTANPNFCVLGGYFRIYIQSRMESTGAMLSFLWLGLSYRSMPAQAGFIREEKQQKGSFLKFFVVSFDISFTITTINSVPYS
jgi:hypothetical protein